MEQQAIIADLERRAKLLGLSISEVCRRASIHPTTFSRWKLSEKNPEPVGANLKSLNALNDVVAQLESAGSPEAPAEAA